MTPPHDRPGDADFPALITQEYKPVVHLGVDLAYKRYAPGTLPQFAPPHDSTGLYFAPPTTPILAARDGVVWSVGPSPRGLSVVISHAKPFATYYQHLASSNLPTHVGGRRVGGGDAVRVRAGDVIGTMGYDPIDPQAFRHLHFAVWYNGASLHRDDVSSVDPADMLRNATRSTWRI
jgi:murein DD-endopeptidase MepM/ murein hydrolase activator NlpD